MTKIAFTGDVAFSKYFKDSCDRPELLSDEVVGFLSDSDYTVVNVEGAVSDGSPSAAKPLLHSNSPECVKWISKINGKIWNLANNHTTDCGLEGVESTLNIARENGFITVGLGRNISEAQKPVIIESSDGNIGIISVTYTGIPQADENNYGCVVWDDYSKIREMISEVNKKCRWCVMVIHAGYEFSQLPLPHVRRRYRKYLDMGADVIVGHHPHIAENYEIVGDKIIFYSLGNFIFDTDYQRLQRYTENGILLKLEFLKEKFSWEYMPVHIDRETNKVVKGKHPAIFTNINQKNYMLLWPLSARNLYQNERVKYAILRDWQKDFTKIQWLWWEIKNCRTRKGAEIMLGRVLYYLQLWRFSYKEIIEYIRNGR